jgi:hypothetical protein
MKHLIVIAFWATAGVLGAQNSISLAYFGETITHPGLKVGISFPLYEWEKHKMLRNGREKLLAKRIDLSPQLGFYYHQDYQTGLFVLPELSYNRQNAKGNYTALGLGTGYMHTRVPRVYDFDANGEIEQVRSGHHYFISNYFATFGKDFSVKKGIPFSIYAKPQLMHALPNAGKGIWYFVLELGLSVKMSE